MHTEYYIYHISTFVIKEVFVFPTTSCCASFVLIFFVFLSLLVSSYWPRLALIRHIRTLTFYICFFGFIHIVWCISIATACCWASSSVQTVVVVLILLLLVHPGVVHIFRVCEWHFVLWYNFGTHEGCGFSSSIPDIPTGSRRSPFLQLT